MVRYTRLASKMRLQDQIFPSWLQLLLTKHAFASLQNHSCLAAFHYESKREAPVHRYHQMGKGVDELRENFDCLLFPGCGPTGNWPSGLSSNAYCAAQWVFHAPMDSSGVAYSSLRTFRQLNSSREIQLAAMLSGFILGAAHFFMMFLCWFLPLRSQHPLAAVCCFVRLVFFINWLRITVLAILSYKTFDYTAYYLYPPAWHSVYVLW